MTKQEFRKLVCSKLTILDGATGSNLQKAGMASGDCPEQWILNHEDVLVELQKQYVQAGSDIIYAPTFTSNRIKLEEYGLQDKIKEINTKLVELSKRAVKESETDHPVYIAGDLTMTGEQLYPMGTLPFEELVDIYKEQAVSLVKAGVDLFVVETMMSLQECRAALLAIKEISDLPVMITLTFQEDLRTLFGTSPETAVIVLQAMGADAVGVNCSTGPDKMCEIIKRMKAYAKVPLIAKPNAGLPVLVDGKTMYAMDADEFSLEMKPIIETGANIVGGCCGTTPLHIKQLVEKNAGCQTIPAVDSIKSILTTERNFCEIDLDGKFMVVGERINPTGKKDLQAQLREGNLDLVLSMAEEQIEKGARILDVNMGMNGIDEKEMMVQAVYELSTAVDVPLSIDSSYVEVIEAALRIYPGRALINSISLEKEKFEKLIPIAKKYGAMFILLPLSEAGLPKSLEEKIQIIDTIYKEACNQGLSKEDIIVDGLVTTIGANKKAALEVFETIRYCKNELKVATICGLSNISFGLPERQFVNSTFVALAIKEGLTMAIANPSQALLMNAALAADLLLNKEEADLSYINGVSTGNFSANTTTETNHKKETQELRSNLFQMVLKGNKKAIINEVKKVMAEGKQPSEIINMELIPAITHVGGLFEKQEYFLPQLIASAEAMKTAIDFLEPLLKTGSKGDEKETIVMATVKGDIHDIGKNLVCLMLKNYGYHVIDLGKDVDRDEIVKAANENHASIIGLSALMTTTMMEMKEVISCVKKNDVKAKIIVGGAVVTEGFAEEIGADGYSKDANEAVKLVNRLLGRK